MKWITLLPFLFCFSQSKAQNIELILPEGHSIEPIQSTKISSTKKYLLTTSYSKICLWDFTSGRELLNITVDAKSIPFCFLSADEKNIIAVTNKSVNIFSVEDGHLVHSNPIEFGEEISLKCEVYTDALLAFKLADEVLLFDIISGKTVATYHVSNAISFRMNADKTKIYVVAKLRGIVQLALPSLKELSRKDITDGFFDEDPTIIFNTAGTEYFVTGKQSDELFCRRFNSEKGDTLPMPDLTGTTAVYEPHYFNNDSLLVLVADSELVVWDNFKNKLITKSTIPDYDVFTQNQVSISPSLPLVSIAGYDSTVVWDLQQNKFYPDIRDPSNPYNYTLAYLGRDTALLQSSSGVVLYNYETKEQLAEFAGHCHEIRHLTIRSDSTYDFVTIAPTSSQSFYGQVWESNTGTLLRYLSVDESRDLYLDRYSKSNPSDKFFAVYGDSTIQLYKIANGKSSSTKKINAGARTWDVAFMKRSDKVLFYEYKNYQGRYSMLDLNTNLQTSLFQTEGEPVHLAINNDDSKLVAGEWGGDLSVYDIGRKKKDTSFFVNESLVNSVYYDRSGKYLISSYSNGETMIWNALTYKLEKKIKGDRSVMNAAGDKIITVTKGRMNVFSFPVCSLQYSIIPVDSFDFVALLPDQYFLTSTRSINKVLSYKSGKDFISFDQLDVKFNRPDKVLKAMGSTDTALIQSFNKAYLKRVEKLHIDTSSFKQDFRAPVADFVNRAGIPNLTTEKRLRLEIRATAERPIRTFNIWVNDVPLFGQQGLQCSGRMSFDTAVALNLSEGQNRIETSVTLDNGIESFRKPVFIKYNSITPAKSRTFFIGIGIDEFSEKGHSLNWSVKDIRDLSRRFGLHGASVDTFFDKQVTRENILALRNKLVATTEEDKIIIAYSGHGLLSKDFDYYLSTYNVNFNDPVKGGLSYEELERLLDNIPARKKLLLIDACHSGEVDKEETKKYQLAKDAIGKNGVKGLIIEPKEGTGLGMMNSFELMQDLFVNVGRGKGTTIISAAAGTQFALERGDLSNGVFTYCLLQIIDELKNVRVSQLKNAVSTMVPELTDGLQKPTFRSETKQYDWSLW